MNILSKRNLNINCKKSCKKFIFLHLHVDSAGLKDIMALFKHPKQKYRLTKLAVDWKDWEEEHQK